MLCARKGWLALSDRVSPALAAAVGTLGAERERSGAAVAQ